MGCFPRLLRSAIAFLSMNPRKLAGPGASSTASQRNGISPITLLTAVSRWRSHSRTSRETVPRLSQVGQSSPPLSLSANLTETPAPLGITAGGGESNDRERESMTLQEMDAPALGVEERRDEAPGAGASHARPMAKPKRRKFTAQYRLRILEVCRELHAARRARGAVQLPSDGMAQGAAVSQGLTPSKRGRKPVAQPPQREGARARGESGSAGEGAAHRPYDPGRPGSCRAWDLRTREGLLMAVQPLASRSAWRRRAERLPREVVRGPLPGISSVLRPPGPCVRPNARPRRARQPALRRPVTGRGRRDAAR